jgi:hypothetical protein
MKLAYQARIETEAMQAARDYLEDCAMRAKLTPHDFARQLITLFDEGDDPAKSEATMVHGEFFLHVSKALQFHDYTHEEIGKLANSVIFMAAESWGAHGD